jgi:hypothetical protein
MNAAETSPRPVVHALSLLTDAERADPIMLCVSRARSGEWVLGR